MEMNLAELDPNDLPDAEKAFIASFLRANLERYVAAFDFEAITLAHLASKFVWLNDYSNVAVLRTGSGGRFEGMGVGDGDLILLTRDVSAKGSYPLDKVDELVAKLEEPTSAGLQTWTHSVELKSLNADLVSYTNGRPYTGRILESEFLGGNRGIMTDARRLVFEEIANDQEILKGLKKQLREHKKTCRTGKQRFQGKELVHFNPDAGVVFYDPAERLFGLKHGFLRYAQVAQSIEIYEYYLRTKVLTEDMLDLNQSVEERARFCLRKHWVKEDRVDAYISTVLAYAKLLQVNIELKSSYHQHGPVETCLSS